jgi:hypothetical protein
MANTTTGLAADEAVAHQKALSIRKKVSDLLDTELEHLIDTLNVKQSDNVVITTLVREKTALIEENKRLVVASEKAARQSDGASATLVLVKEKIALIDENKRLAASEKAACNEASDLQQQLNVVVTTLVKKKSALIEENKHLQSLETSLRWEIEILKGSEKKAKKAIKLAQDKLLGADAIIVDDIDDVDNNDDDEDEDEDEDDDDDEYEYGDDDDDDDDDEDYDYVDDDQDLKTKISLIVPKLKATRTRSSRLAAQKKVKAMTAELLLRDKSERLLKRRVQNLKKGINEANVILEQAWAIDID